MSTDVTVAIPARNAAPYLGAALDSVLRQEGVSLQVIVVDDASDDDTFAVATQYADARVRVLRQPRHLGIGACHNRILGEATTEFVAHVDADDVVLPGALARQVQALREAPEAAQAYCDFFPTPPDGRHDGAVIARWQDALSRARRPPIPVRRHLLLHGMVVNHLRTYRREALLAVGGFDESLPWAVDYDMALRLADRWGFVHVPAILYAKRILPQGASESVTWKPLRFWGMRWRLARRHLRRRGGRLLGYPAPVVHALLLAGLVGALGETVAATGRAMRGRGVLDVP